MYNKAIIGFGFCDMQNYQCLDKSYLNIDNSAYHKIESNNCLLFISLDTDCFHNE